MGESKKLKIIEESISKFTKNYIAKQIYNEKLGKSLLYVYLKQSKHVVEVFDEDFGISEIARIDYAINNRGVYISDFIVDDEFQQKGIGRSLFNIAVAHGDRSGAKLVYGTAAPISPIHGVSTNDDGSFLRERQVLIEIYTRLGCAFDEQVSDESDFKFYQKWDAGDKFSKLKSPFNIFVDSIIEQVDYNSK